MAPSKPQEGQPITWCYGDSPHSHAVFSRGKEALQGMRPYVVYRCTECEHTLTVWDPQDPKAWKKLEEGAWIERYGK